MHHISGCRTLDKGDAHSEITLDNFSKTAVTGDAVLKIEVPPGAWGTNTFQVQRNRVPGFT
jgi:hypothetical protein